MRKVPFLVFSKSRLVFVVFHRRLLFLWWYYADELDARYNLKHHSTKREKLDSRNGKRMRRLSHCIKFCLILLAVTCFQYYAIAFEPQAVQFPKDAPTVRGLSVHRVPLRRLQQQQHQDGSGSYCFALSSMLDLPTNSNILATQVWPSARVAAMTLEERLLAENSLLSSCSSDDEKVERTTKFTICELGCGPGLPSLTAAAAAASQKTKVDFQVIATDIDEFALDLVNAAAKDQGLDHIVSTRRVDLIECGSKDWKEEENAWMRDVDLFVMSDVFELNAVATGAARFTQRVLSWEDEDIIDKNGQIVEPQGKRKWMWVFAQTDRTQREVYLEELQKDNSSPTSLNWKAPEKYGLEDRLWLCDVDETTVNYG